MCGVAGAFAPGTARQHQSAVAAMVDGLSHRGPDDNGLHVEDDIVLGHDRLSIIDLSERAAQPMVSADDRYVISYNGEVFNFRDIRARLERLGCRLRSTGDTEVLLEAIAWLGLDETLVLLEGDWAFALWDRMERRLVLARDRHGVKPMYYTRGQGVVRFASEMKVLVDGQTQPDMATVNSCLLGFSGTWGDRTVFRDVRSLRAGEVVVFTRTDEQPTARTFAAITDFVDPDLAAELDVAPSAWVLDRVAEAFRSSTRLRMISDAPLACLASGGVDSSFIASLARDENPNLQLYHADVSFDSERDAAQELASALGLQLHVTRVTPELFLDSIAAATFHNDLPLIYHLNSVPFYLVSELARSHGMKVILTGEGSDEYFLGYPQYALAPVLEAVDASKEGLRVALRRLSPKLMDLLWPGRGNQYSDMLRSLTSRYEKETVRASSRAALPYADSRRERRASEMTLDLVQGHLLSLLQRNDRLGMAWSLESRFPFLGHELAHLAVNLPARYKLRHTSRLHDRRHPFTIDKWVVRALAERHVPVSLATRPKRGFQVPVAQRLVIDPAYFADGYVVEEYGLTQDGIERVLATPRRMWPVRVFLLDVWGRMFLHGESVAEVQKRIREHVRVAA